MEEKRTLFEYLYKNLREQILTGYLKYGDPLPSMSQLCENYHVGIRTVKDVLAALKKEGLIHTEERRPSIVAYQPGGAEGTCHKIRAGAETYDSGGL